MGDEQKGTWQELLARNRAEFDSGTDLTLAVEEEFALVDPDSLELTQPVRGAEAAPRIAPTSPTTSSAS